MILTKRHYLMGSGAASLASALVFASAAYPGSPDAVTVPQHTPIHVVLDQKVTSKEKPGTHFRTTVSQPVVVDGKTVIPKGSHAEGVIVEAKPSGRLKGKAEMKLALRDVSVNGKQYEVRTMSTREYSGGHKKRNILWIGGGAGGGALIGAAAAGGTGALIGGPVGAGAGFTYALITGKKNVKLRPETPVTFKLAEPVTIDAKNAKS